MALAPAGTWEGSAGQGQAAMSGSSLPVPLTSIERNSPGVAGHPTGVLARFLVARLWGCGGRQGRVLCAPSSLEPSRAGPLQRRPLTGSPSVAHGTSWFGGETAVTFVHVRVKNVTKGHPLPRVPPVSWGSGPRHPQPQALALLLAQGGCRGIL